MDIIYITLGTAITSTILGWLLGILTPSIVKKITEKTERDNLKKIVFNDLKELKKRLAPLPYTVYPKYGKLDTKTFEWLKINSGIGFSEGLAVLSKQGQSEEQVIANLNARGSQEKTSVYFKKMHLFAIDSQLMNLGIIENGLMEKILEVRFYVEALNEDIDTYREDLKMTFLPGITDNNYQIVSQQIDKKSLMIAEKSMYIVDKINDVLKGHISG